MKTEYFVDRTKNQTLFATYLTHWYGAIPRSVIGAAQRVHPHE